MSTNRNYEALQEILTYITLHTSRGNVITLKHIVEYFQRNLMDGKHFLFMAWLQSYGYISKFK